MIAGTARVTAVDQAGRNFIADVGPSDLWYFPAGIPHSIQGLEQGCEFLLVFDDGNFSENETFLITDSNNFRVSKTIAAAVVEVEPGCMRELHWHPNADEWQYYLSGRGRMTVFASSGKARTFDYQAGDVGYVPFAMGHCVENTGDTVLRFLEMFRSPRFADVSLNQWMALTPPELVQAHLNIDEATMRVLTSDKPVVVGAAGPRDGGTSLPVWPTMTIAVLSTVDGDPHAIPVTAPLRAGARRVLLALKRDCASLARLRRRPEVALAVLAAGDEAFTARGRASVVQEPMTRAPEYAAVVIDVDEIDDDRLSAVTVESGVDVQRMN